MPNGTADDNGQGNAGIFDSYLADVPEEHRAAVEGYLKDAERHVNTRLQTAAELERQFGAYTDVDLSGYTPEQLGQVLGWYGEVSASPEAFKSWVETAAREQGILEDGETLDDGEIDVPQTKAELDAYVREAVQNAISPVIEQTQSIQQETQLQNLERQIAADFTALETEHGITLTDEDKQTIVDLGEAHEGRDWIPEGFKRLQAIQGEAATRFVQDRQRQPKPGIPPGGQEAPARVTDWKEATRMAAARITQANNA